MAIAMKQRTRTRRLKLAASKHPAMAPLPHGSWFLEVPPSMAYDLAARPDTTVVTELRNGEIVFIRAW